MCRSKLCTIQLSVSDTGHGQMRKGKAGPESSVCPSLPKFFRLDSSWNGGDSSVSSHFHRILLLGVWRYLKHNHINRFLQKCFTPHVRNDFILSVLNLPLNSTTHDFKIMCCKLIPVCLLVILALGHLFPSLKNPGLFHSFLHRWHLCLWSAMLPLSVPFSFLLYLKQKDQKCA